MAPPQRVTIGDLNPRGNSWRIRWRVDGKQFERNFRRKGVGDRFRRTLFDAADAGAQWDRRSGEPLSWGQRECPTVAEWARTWFVQRWGELAAKTRSSDAELVVDVVTLTLAVPAPTDVAVRTWVRRVVCRRPDAPEPTFDEARLVRAALHVERHSPRLDEIDDEAARELWASLGKRLDGNAAAATTSNRRRTLATKIFDDAARAGLLEANPLRRIDRPRRRAAMSVDPTALPSPAEARDLIEEVARCGDVGARSRAYLLTMLLSGCRPAEALGLRTSDAQRPRTPGAWGHVAFRRGHTQSAAAWTDDGEAWDARSSLKWRAEGEVRRAAVPPEFFEVVDSHVERFGTAPDGRLFATSGGTPIAGDLSGVWRRVVAERWPEGHPFHGLRPYDLRHIHATALLVEGISPMRVAKRLGHSVEVLFRTYAGVFTDGDDAERQLIGAALGA